MTVTPVSARTLGDQVWIALDAVAAVNAFRGRVEIPPFRADDPDTNLFWDLDTAGRPMGVHAYAVLYEPPGRRYATRICASPNNLDGTFQVTCAGRDTTTCLWTVDKVTAALLALRLTPEGRTKPVRLVEDESNASRTALIDEDVSPARWFVPLLFRLHI